MGCESIFAWHKQWIVVARWEPRVLRDSRAPAPQDSDGHEVDDSESGGVEAQIEPPGGRLGIESGQAVCVEALLQRMHVDVA